MPRLPGLGRKSHAPAGTPGTATKLAFAVQPSGATTEAALTGQPIVEVRDAFNTLVSGSSASIAIAVGVGAGSLSGTTPVSAAGGIATFTDLTITGTGNHTLVASSAGLTSAQSNVLNVAALGNYLLLETGDYFLLETGDYLQLEA